MKEKNGIIKNILFLSFSFMINFFAFNGIQNLQSSINCEEGLGAASQTSIYIGIMIGSLFLPSISIQKLGLKWTLTLSILGYLSHALAQIYPTFYTLIPTALLSGLTGSTLWGAHAQYLTVSAGNMAKIKNEENEKIVNRFWGIFFGIFHTNQIGNLISSVIINDNQVPQFSSLSNATQQEVDATAARCGVNQPAYDENESICDGNTIPEKTTYILMGCYSGIIFLSFLLASFGIDNLEIPEIKNKTSVLQL